MASNAVLRLQRAAGNTAVQQLLSRTPSGPPDPIPGHGSRPVQLQPAPPAPPAAPPAKSSTETLNEQITSGNFKEALEFLNGRSMENMIFHVEKVGFANANYLLANLGVVAWLGPRALGRLEVGIRSVGIRQTSTTGDLLLPLLDALKRSGVREYSDQLAAIRRNVMPPAGGWATLVQQYLAMADLAAFAVLTAVDNVFRVLDFVTDSDMSQALATLNEQQLRLLIVNNKSADRYQGERLRRGLDAAWRSRFPLVEPPWPKAAMAGGLNVSTMSTMDKLAEAIRRSEKYGGEEFKGKLEELLSPQSLAMMAGTVILFAVLEASTAGAAGVALVALSAAMIGPEVYQVVGDINGFITTAAGATDEEALERAGQYFAKAAVAISVDVLVAVLLHKPTKAATPRIQATARAAGEFLKSRTAPPGGRPSGELIPALAIAGDGTPRFVQAPPQRLTTLESTGSGKGAGPVGTPPAYDQMSLQQLRKLARTDKAAAEALIDRYRVMSDADLRKRRSAGDETAKAVLDQRISPNDADLARALGSDYRPPHSATIMIRRQGAGEVFRGELTSGNMTSQEAALGYPRNSLATHTEARAVRRPELQAGDHLIIDGQYDPCSSCRRAMFTASRWLGITIEYRWSGGTARFP